MLRWSGITNSVNNMDELLQRLQKLNIGYCVGHEWYDDDC